MAPGRKKVDKAEPKAKRGRRSFPDADNDDHDAVMDSDDSMGSPVKKPVAKSKAKGAAAKGKAKKAQKATAAAEENREEVDPDDVDERRALLENDIDDENLLNMIIPPPPEQMVEGDRNKRLMISSIEVENFKSYYGKQVIGPFHKNFTAIIGPNGSGKSNVIDSLLFVFGYRAAKIRSKKVSVLIHNSANHDDIDKCRVQVNFQQIIDEPDGKYTVIPGSEFNVARTGYKNNSSQYHYNGKAMHFKEVAKILRGVGIDLVHNRFLILQGEVEQISLMKPKAPNPNEEGMLEYLEDIIGCSRLKEPIERLNDKCTKLQEQRTIQFSRVKHAEREKEALENPVREIMHHLRLENAAALLDSKKLYRQLYKKQDLLETLTPEVEQSKATIKEKNENLKELLKLQDEQSKELKKLQKSLEQAQDGLMNTKTSLSTVEGELQTKRKEIKRNAEKIEKIKADIKKEEKKMIDYESQPEKCEKKIAEQKQVALEAQEDEEKYQKLLDEKLAEIEEKSAELNDEKKEREVALDGAVSKRDAVESKLRIAKTEHSNLCDEGAREENKLKEITQALADNENNLEEKASELNKVKEAIPVKEQAITDAENRRTELKKRREELDQEIRPLRAKYEEEKSASSNVQAQNKVGQALMREKEKGTIEGIYGRLGDLGAIPEKYDVAISTTCGKLNNFVVSTVEAAEACINFLKKNNVGHASFIVLDKQRHLISRMRQKPQTPENAPRLFDLITVKDEDVLPAFYFALQDTLYAEDIGSATKISMNYGKRWRVVTAKGELVDTGGTMTGGGTRVVKGLIGTSVKVDTSNRRMSGVNLEEMQRRLQSLEREISDVERELSAVTRQIEVLKREKNDLEGRYVHIENTIGNLTSRLSGLKESQAAQQASMRNTTRNDGAIEEAKEKVDKLQKEKDNAEEVVKKHKAQVREVSDRLQEIFDEIKGDCQKNLDDAKKRKADANKAVTTQQTALNNVSRNMAKTKKKISELNSDIERAESAITDDEAKIAELEEHFETLSEKIKEGEKAKIEAEEALKEATSKNTESNEEEISLKNELNALEKSLKGLQEKVAKIKYDIDRYAAELSKLVFQYVTFVNRLPSALTAPDNSNEILAEAYNIEMEALRKKKRGNKVADADTDGEAEPMQTDDDPLVEVTSDEEEEPEVSVNTMIGTIEIPAPSKDAIKEWSDQQLEYHMVQLDELKVKKNYDFNNLVEFYHKLVKYEKECRELDEISAKRDAHRNFLAELKAQRHNEFMDGFQKIGSALKEMYQMITLGGDASLDLVDSLDPFNEGVSFGVRPPKKSWKQITNLSGGEKTLSSLALVFALHQYKPTPLYVMDEIDAALDFRNVSIIGHYIKEKTKNAQFIIISLRNNMFELGDRLVGIYKTFDCTKNVCVDPDEVAKKTAKKVEVLEEQKQQRAAKVKKALQDAGGLGLNPETPIVIS